MKRTCAIIALVALSACAKVAPPPAVEIRTVTVTKEVMKPCPVTVPTRPVKIARPLPTDPIALAAVLTLKLLEYDGPGAYADRADAALATCTKPQ